MSRKIRQTYGIAFLFIFVLIYICLINSHPNINIHSISQSNFCIGTSIFLILILILGIILKINLFILIISLIIIAIVIIPALSIVNILSIYNEYITDFSNFLNENKTIEKNNYGVLGTFGDFVGGLLNPIFGFLAFCGVLITIGIQGRELKDTKEQLNLQRFESSFYKRFDAYFTIVNSIDLRLCGANHPHPKGKDCFENLYLMLGIIYEMFIWYGIEEGRDESNNENDIKISKEEIKDKLLVNNNVCRIFVTLERKIDDNKEYIENFASKLTQEYKIVKEYSEQNDGDNRYKDKEILKKAYRMFLSLYSPDLSHYNDYLELWIEFTYKFENHGPNEKNEYSKIIFSLLSKYEKLILAYHCIYIEEEKGTFSENLRRHFTHEYRDKDLLHETHSRFF